LLTRDWVRPHKTFLGVKLLTLFSKLDLFITMHQMSQKFIKGCSFQKSASKFIPKLFYEIDPRASTYAKESPIARVGGGGGREGEEKEKMMMKTKIKMTSGCTLTCRERQIE